MKTPVENSIESPPDSFPVDGVMVECYAVTDVGRTRGHNEDAFAVVDLTEKGTLTFSDAERLEAGQHGVLFMVADGMGGAAAGELASATAVDVVTRYLSEAWQPADDNAASDFVAAIEEATELANRTIFAHAAAHPELRGMGTTATIAGLLGDSLYLAQVGDSRAYLMREGVVRQITKDQSLMQRLIEAGEISEEDAQHNERRNIILQALGPEAAIKIDLTHQPLRHDDVLILCSDGLSGIVTAEEIARVVREEHDLATCCRRLVALANAHGGPDNITVVAARFTGDALLPPDDGDHVGHQTYEMPGRELPPSGTVTDLLRDKSDNLLLLTPPNGYPTAVREARRETGLIVRGVLAAAGVVLGAYLVWRLLQLL